MQTYFNIRYEFDRSAVWRCIDQQLKEERADYICVADGVILNIANRDAEYLKVVNGGMFAICDSSYVPLYLKWIYGKQYEQYCGSQIFMDIVKCRKYRMIFMGTSQAILDGLQANLMKVNPDVANMQFIELPFRRVEDFDYKEIAEVIEKDKADIIWVALGAPKQEIFMSKLKSYLKHGVMIAVGAAFKFYSGIDVKRAPEWMVKNHLEFVYRIFCEPKKQLKRCGWIVLTLPKLLIGEWRRKNRNVSF
jgi:N-acetylglucosaminyldiphosphoundecaprenol N-acetyl-beta-D-mannosaminyltransferase